MAITLNGTTGITTPDIDTDGLSVDTNAIFVDPATNNVGIGTSAPATKLDVNGDVTQRNGTGTIIGTILNNSGFYDFNGSNNVNGAQMSHSAIVRFLTASAERARIDPSGNLLVGATAQFNFGKQCIAFNGTNNFGIALKDVVNQSSARFIGFMNADGAVIGAIDRVTTTNTVQYITSSDYRLKENIVPMTGALATVAKLNPVTYTWKADGIAAQGFIAHELQAVVPDCVSGVKDEVYKDGKPKHQGVDTSFLVATLTAAIQEQQTLIQALTARIEALEVA